MSGEDPEEEDPEVDTEVCCLAGLVPCNLACLALKEEHDSWWADLQLVEMVEVACWEPVKSRSLPAQVGLGELHSLLELGRAGKFHSLLGVGWVESLRVVA